jgi:diguanylate cyclase (GGDEF)-like protein
MSHPNLEPDASHLAGLAFVDLVAQRDRAAAALDRLEAALLRKRAEDYLQQTYRDDLTGALQREAGRDRLVTELSRADRTHGTVVIAFLDVAGLKGINDRYGHAIGDLVLTAVGSALVAGLRAYDVVVRYGGDEFVCGLPGTTVAAARQRLTDIAATLAGHGPAIDLSSGVALREPGETLDHVIGRADQAMYESRQRALVEDHTEGVLTARRG